MRERQTPPPGSNYDQYFSNHCSSYPRCKQQDQYRAAKLFGIDAKPSEQKRSSMILNDGYIPRRERNGVSIKEKIITPSNKIQNIFALPSKNITLAPISLIKSCCNLLIITDAMIIDTIRTIKSITFCISVPPFFVVFRQDAIQRQRIAVLQEYWRGGIHRYVQKRQETGQFKKTKILSLEKYDELVKIARREREQLTSAKDRHSIGFNEYPGASVTVPSLKKLRFICYAVNCRCSSTHSAGILSRIPL